MPYIDTDDGHRIGLSGEVMTHAREVFEKGFQLEAILLAHEYLEQRLNHLYSQAVQGEPATVHRKFKNLIDVLASSGVVHDEDYSILNEFNRLRNVNSNLILNSSLTLSGAKKGDMAKAMALADESEKTISRLSSEIENRRLRKKNRKNG